MEIKQWYKIRPLKTVEGNASSSTNPQAIVQALLLQSSALPGYKPLQRPGFVHLIS